MEQTLYKEAFVNGMVDYLDKEAWMGLEKILPWAGKGLSLAGQGLKWAGKTRPAQWGGKLGTRILSGKQTGLEAVPRTWSNALKYGLQYNPKSTLAKLGIPLAATSYGLGSWGKGDMQDQISGLTGQNAQAQALLKKYQSTLESMQKANVQGQQGFMGNFSKSPWMPMALALGGGTLLGSLLNR